MAALGELGAQVLPVVLCNDKAGCPDDSFHEADHGPHAGQGQDGRRICCRFSAACWPRWSPACTSWTRAMAAQLEFNIRPEHGADTTGNRGRQRWRAGASSTTATPLPSPAPFKATTVLVNIVDAQGLAAGKWTVQTRGGGAFAVVQTQTYPELTFPPSSIAGSSVAPYYVPAGKPVALLARIVGPGSAEPLHLEDGTDPQALWRARRALMDRIAGRCRRIHTPGRRRQGAAADPAPLQSAGAGRPAHACWPCHPQQLRPARRTQPVRCEPPSVPGPRYPKRKGWSTSRDESAAGKLAYSGPMVCAGRECADEARGFQRLDGHHYTVRFFVQARSAGVLFGDWAETTLAVAPAVRLQGLAGDAQSKDAALRRVAGDGHGRHDRGSRAVARRASR